MVAVWILQKALKEKKYELENEQYSCDLQQACPYFAFKASY